jgi:hypothetical protein
VVRRAAESTNARLVKRQVFEVALLAAIVCLGFGAGLPIPRLDQKNAASGLAQLNGKRDTGDAAADDAGIEYDRRKIRAMLGQVD